MRTIVSLPKATSGRKNPALVETIDQITSRVVRERNFRLVEWIVSKHWLDGIRDFGAPNFQKGSIKIGHRTPVGEQKIRIEDALSKAQIEMGRLNLLNLRPKVKPRPYGLEAQRLAAMGQVEFDYILEPDRLNAVISEAWKHAVHYGPAGITPVIDAWPDGTPIFELAVIPPWELGPIPASARSVEEVAGILRDRWVPVQHLRDRGFDIPQNIDKDSDLAKALELRTVPHGDVIDDFVLGGADSSKGDTLSRKVHAHLDNFPSSIPDKKREGAFVRLIEVWMEGPKKTLARAISKAGRVVLEDKTFGDEKWKAANQDKPEPPPFPIGVGGYYAVGSFWFRGFIAPIISLNHEVEKLIGSVFKQVRDHDQYGMVLIPAGMGLNERQMKESSQPRIGRYQPDPMSQNGGITTLRPVNAGPLAAQASQIALSLVDRQANQGEMFSGQAPGSIDSQVGLNFLFQTTNVPLDIPGKSMSAAFIQAYKALMYEAKIRLGGVDKIQLTRVDDAVAGVVLDPTTGEVSLESNGLPWPHEIEMTVQSVSPTPPEAKLQQLMGFLQNGMISQEEFWIGVFREGIEMPSVKKNIEAAVEKAQLNHIVLFGDGQTPGEIFFEPEADMVQIFLLMLSDFMQKTMWSLADPTVQMKFLEYKELLLGRAPGVVPEGVPTLEEASIQAQALSEQAQQQQLSV